MAPTHTTTVLILFLTFLIYHQSLAFFDGMFVIPESDKLEGGLYDRNKNSGCIATTKVSQEEQTLHCPHYDHEKAQMTVRYGRDVQIICSGVDVNLSDYTIDVGEVTGFGSKKCNLVDQLSLIFSKWDIAGVEKFYLHNFSDKDFVLQRKYFDNVNVSVVTSVVIQYSNIIGIEEDMFQDFTSLEMLSLTWNKINQLPDLTGLQRLRSIDFGSNQITHLPDFLDVPSLRSLILWKNNITTINETCFINATSLKILELKNNQIKYLPEKVLHPLTKLTEVSLTDLIELPKNFFKTNTELTKIVLSSAEMTSIPEDAFRNLSNLTTLILHGTSLETLPKDLLATQTNLLQLYLHDNRFKTFPKGLFRNLQSLTLLNLYNNQLDDWNCLTKLLPNLRTLDLRRNKFRVIKSNFADYTEKLKKLDLSSNNISEIEPGAFNSLELNELDLSSNRLYAVDDIMDYSGLRRASKLDLSHNFFNTTPDIMGRVTTMDMSYNKLKVVELYQLNSLESIDLTHNEITYVSFVLMNTLLDKQLTQEVRTTNVKLANNAISCDCHVFPLVQYFDGSYKKERIYNKISIEGDMECHSPENMIGINVKTMKSDTFTCDYTKTYKCPDDCTCTMYPKYESFNISCSSRNLRKAPVIPTFAPHSASDDRFTISKLVIDLRNNSITNFTEKDSSYFNASKLYLSNNQLNLVSWLPPHLSELTLNDNNLENLDYATILTLNNSKTLQQVTLHNNPWNCDCKLLNFTKLVKHIHSKIPFEDTLLCSDNKKIVGLVEANLCGIENQVALTVIGACFFMFLITICVALVLYYKYEYQVKVWLYSKPIFMWFVVEEELDKDKLYDAFLSYSHQDEEFVINELLPQLEHCRNPYKLCIHVRDWVVGEFITKQIMDSVDQSRRTIIILSPHFLKSEWATMEFRTAHTQAMKEGRNRLIVILYGDIDPNAVEDEDLRAYLSTNTYVKWGDPWFWKKLRYVLPHRKDEDNNNVESNSRRKLKNKRMENIMVTIDKMDLIHSPVTPNLGTPPAVSLDPLLVKGNALDFKNNANAQTPPAESGLVTSMTC